MSRPLAAAAVIALGLLAGCGGSGSSSASPESRPIVISSTNTPGPPAPTPSGGPAAPVSTVLTPFATSLPTQAAAPSPAQTPATSASAAGAQNQVRIADFGFTPPALNVPAGTQVTWTNAGPSNHTVTANNGAFDSGTIQANGTFSFTFTTAGTFAYHCSLHPTMQATVVVS